MKYLVMFLVIMAVLVIPGIGCDPPCPPEPEPVVVQPILTPPPNYVKVLGPVPGGAGSWGVPLICPFCQQLVFYDKQIKQVERDNPQGYRDSAGNIIKVTDLILICDKCGYSTERDAMGNLKTQITSTAQANYGAKFWPINQGK